MTESRKPGKNEEGLFGGKRPKFQPDRHDEPYHDFLERLKNHKKKVGEPLPPDYGKPVIKDQPKKK